MQIMLCYPRLPLQISPNFSNSLKKQLKILGFLKKWFSIFSLFYFYRGLGRDPSNPSDKCEKTSWCSNMILGTVLLSLPCSLMGLPWLVGHISPVWEPLDLTISFWVSFHEQQFISSKTDLIHLMKWTIVCQRLCLNSRGQCEQRLASWQDGLAALGFIF